MSAKALRNAFEAIKKGPPLSRDAQILLLFLASEADDQNTAEATDLQLAMALRDMTVPMFRQMLADAEEVEKMQVQRKGGDDGKG